MRYNRFGLQAMTCWGKYAMSQNHNVNIIDIYGKLSQVPDAHASHVGVFWWGWEMLLLRKGPTHSVALRLALDSWRS